MEDTITVTRRGEERIRNGHFWVYRADIASGRAEAGSVVRVAGPAGRFLARAFYSDRSQITLRILTQRDVEVTQASGANGSNRRSGFEIGWAWMRQPAASCMAREISFRRSSSIATATTWSTQALSQGADRLLPEATQLLIDLTDPKGILARNDPRVRLLEGLDQSVAVLHGDIPER